MKICVSGSIAYYSNQGGQASMYLNWARGLSSLGCEVTFLHRDDPRRQIELDEYADIITRTIGIKGCQVAFASDDGRPLAKSSAGSYLTLDEIASEVDLYINPGYISRPDVVGRFRRSAYVDTDPGVFQIWLDTGAIVCAPHDIYFTISETVGTGQSSVPDCGIRWHFTPPPIYLPAWPVSDADPSAHFTTVSNWWGGEWVSFNGQVHDNRKRTSFLEYVDLPRLSNAPLELALTLGDGEADAAERKRLEGSGWSIHALKSAEVAWTPDAYRDYVRQSRGEFSCAKPMYVELQTALVFDRTLHYLGSGKPAIVQDTGPSRFLPDSEGLFRFRTIEEAVVALETVQADYETHCRHARALAEEHFDSKKVLTALLEKALA